MKANDLRIGNWVMDKEDNIYGKIDSFYGREIFIDDWHNGTTLLNECDPIPLTEEWLLKFGFKKHKTDDRYITFAKANININDGIVNLVGYPNFLNHIKHVHQLQNLYHSLTQKEL